MRVSGGCHCGAVRFSITVAASVDLLDCNCSICVRSGYLHLNVPHVHFRLRQGQENLTSYRFGTGAAEHLFCKTCGIKSFYQPRSHPECWSVNFTCLDPGHGIASDTRKFDGQDWEKGRSELR